MKRSEKIVLVLSGAVASGLTGCSDSGNPKLSASNVYTNNHYVRGAGYYHAGFHGWYPYPHNAYDSQRGYYYGGTWNRLPDGQTVMASKPTADAVTRATAESKAHTAATRRGGFGASSSRSGVS